MFLSIILLIVIFAQISNAYQLSPLNLTCEIPQDSHVYFTYYLRNTDGTVISNNKINTGSVYLPNASPLLKDIFNGLCVNNKREATFSSKEILDLKPLFDSFQLNNDSILEVEFFSITSDEDNKVFELLQQKEYIEILKMLKNHKGVNAVDSNGSSLLMNSINLFNYEIFSAILNSHYPKPNINYHKPTGHNALFYSLLEPKPIMLKFLLLKGADPNQYIYNLNGEEITTPLHYAIEHELFDHAELLLNYGANPFLVNSDEKYAEDLIPEFSLSSKKKKIRNLFEEKNQYWMKKLEEESSNETDSEL